MSRRKMPGSQDFISPKRIAVQVDGNERRQGPGIDERSGDPSHGAGTSGNRLDMRFT
jgi:hypothetical protein